MPGGDKTGPYGQGVGTGRRAGFCYGNGQPGYMTSGGRGGFGGRGFRRQSNRGMGGGFGRGFRFRNQFTDVPMNEAADDLQNHELQQLREDNRRMRETLDELTKRLDALQSNKE
ncbi:MAG: DUF5320 family protein [Candidatus Zixiibacteriota bacterium]